MRTLSVSPPKQRLISLMLVAIIACNSCEEDSPNPTQLPFPDTQPPFSEIEFYTIPESSIIIDLEDFIKQSFVGTSLTISRSPAKGWITELDAYIYKYTPATHFTSGQDHFVYSVVLSDGLIKKEEAIAINIKFSETEFPCGVYPVEDKIRINPASGDVVHVLENDRICDVNGSMNVFIHQQPKFGEAIVAGDSITYVPGPSFSTHDEFVYGISTSGSDDASLGVVSFSNKQVEELEVPSGSNHIFFIDDSIGFVTDGYSIFKTTDGGVRWNHLELHLDDPYLSVIGEIYFLDKNTGFAAVSGCDAWSEYCTGAWMKTTNGGQTWKRFDLDNRLNSIFFTSPEVGFISISTNDYDHDLITNQIIYKTIDGGETWDEVYGREHSSSGLKIRFANDLVGYAYDPTAIYKTADGGQSWERSVSNDIINSFAIAGDEVACASFSSVSNFGSKTTPSEIVRSENGSPWEPVINIPYTILTQGFSPEGNFGLAAGVSDYDALQYFMTISKSTNMGKTWIEVIKQLEGYPVQISVPSANVAYILCTDKLIKYSPE